MHLISSPYGNFYRPAREEQDQFWFSDDSDGDANPSVVYNVKLSICQMWWVDFFFNVME